jgi:hypothetical protein
MQESKLIGYLALLDTLIATKHDLYHCKITDMISHSLIDYKNRKTVRKASL